MLVDSHIHLDRYTDDEVSRMVAEATAAGVRELLTIGTTVESSRAGLRLAGLHPAVRAAAGIHPTQVAALGGPAGERVALQHLAAMLSGGGPALRESRDARDVQGNQPGRPVAIGEVGLDDGAPDLPAQARFLGASLALAAEHALPLVLHVMGGEATHDAALRIVREHPGVRVVAHYFVGGAERARRYLEAGCWLSVGRPATRPADTAIRAAIPTVPANRLMVETDTYPLPGRTTEPRDVTTVCAAVAVLRGTSYAEVARTTTAAYRAFLDG